MTTFHNTFYIKLVRVKGQARKGQGDLDSWLLLISHPYLLILDPLQSQNPVGEFKLLSSGFYRREVQGVFYLAAFLWFTSATGPHSSAWFMWYVITSSFRYFFSIFQHVINWTWSPPAVSLQGVAAAIFILVGDVFRLISTASFTRQIIGEGHCYYCPRLLLGVFSSFLMNPSPIDTLLSYAFVTLCSVGLIVMRYTLPDHPRPLKVPGIGVELSYYLSRVWRNEWKSTAMFPIRSPFF